MSVVTDTRTTVDVLWQDGTRSSAWTPSMSSHPQTMDRRLRQRRCLASAL